MAFPLIPLIKMAATAAKTAGTVAKGVALKGAAIGKGVGGALAGQGALPVASIPANMPAAAAQTAKLSNLQSMANIATTKTIEAGAQVQGLAGMFEGPGTPSATAAPQVHDMGRRPPAGLIDDGQGGFRVRNFRDALEEQFNG